jgi:hypothetical protein
MAQKAQGPRRESLRGHLAQKAQRAPGLGLESHQSHAKTQDYIGGLMEASCRDLHGQLKSIDSIDCYTLSIVTLAIQYHVPPTPSTQD